MRVTKHLVSHYLDVELPFELKTLILLFSGHIRFSTKSVAYFLYLQ